MVKKGWKQLSIHGALWERMRKQVDKENRSKEEWEKKLSGNRYAELSIAAQLEREDLSRGSHIRRAEIDMVAIA